MEQGEMTVRGTNLRQAYGKRTGVVVACGDRFLTVESLQAVVDSLSEALRQAGARPGDRVAALFPNCHLHLAAYFAALQERLILAPLNLRWQAGEIREVLRHAGARLLIGGEG
ncbi:MAG TPA: AMP-binding protein, partial [Candidatus Polarisedimenticolia bacterium]|nr:AMP-binding protein [Candidatus Polarisedimenticolia bacterium]